VRDSVVSLNVAPRRAAATTTSDCCLQRSSLLLLLLKGAAVSRGGDAVPIPRASAHARNWNGAGVAWRQQRWRWDGL